MATDTQLERSLTSIAMPGILVAHRLIEDGDEAALLPAEIAAFGGSVVKVRRASGAARIVARELLSSMGRKPQPLPRSLSGPPIWPEGVVGSLAHDARVAVAALAPRDAYCAVGVDVEPAENLDPDLLQIVAMASELRRLQDDPLGGRLLFSVKEAVYKAVYPLDQTFLDHHDVEVDLQARTASVSNGRLVTFRYCIASHIVALAFIGAP